jgi:hypothetical protein
MVQNEIPVIQYDKKSEANEKVVNAWWKTPDATIYQSVTAVVRGIKQNLSYRRSDNLRFARLYSNTEFDQYLSGVAAGYFGRRLTFNVVRSCVDTACAKISKSRPRPVFLTSKGNFTQQKRAKQLTKYVDGVFYDGKVHQVGKKAFRDACIFGTGCFKIFPLNGKVTFERVFIDEITVDDVDGREGAPRQIHQTKYIHREVAYDMFCNSGNASDDEKARSIISRASIYSTKTKGKTDMVEITESWHLRSGPEANDGKHVICTDTGSLLVESYDKDYFPFVFTRWNPAILGFYGEGLAAQLVGIQLEINTVLLRIKEAQEVMAVPRIFVEEGSGVTSAQITDEIGGIIRYRGTRPDAAVWPAMSAEVYTHLEYLYRKAFEDTGISQLSAMSKKPAGLDSGVALREYQDIETERFALVATAWQDMYLEAAKIAIDIERDLAKEDKGRSVNVKGKGFIETIKWSEVDLEDDKFVMALYPTNLLPKTPEGQLQFTQELIQSGFIDTQEGLSLLDFPDLEGFFSLRTAAVDDVKFIIERMIEDQVYTSPEEYMDLATALKMTQSAYLRAKTDGTSDESKELLLRFIDDCVDLIRAGQAPQAVPLGNGQPPPGGQPGAIAQPEAPPRSDLMPIQ